MSGLLFFIALMLWLYILNWLISKVGRRLPDRPWRPVAKLGIFVLLLPLPLMDEIVGGWQFARLCEANVVRVNKDTARGKTVYVEIGPHQVRVAGTWVPVWKMSFRYVDASTGEILASFDQLKAEGGRLFPGFDSGHDPLTFKSECHPSGSFEKSFSTKLGLLEIKKPESK